MPSLRLFPTPARFARGFSLLELLAVMTIVAVLLGMLAPALNSFGATFGRRGAVNTVMNTLEQARVAALESGRTVFVLFRRSQFPEPDAIAVVREPDTDDTTLQYEGLTKWVKLPKGILLHDAKVDNILKSQVSDSSYDTSRSPVPIDAAKAEYHVLTFNPRGGVSFPDRELILVLSEGVRGSGNMEALIAARKDAGSGFEIVSLRRFTGRASLEITTLAQ